jgi:hypothetical protein
MKNYIKFIKDYKGGNYGTGTGGKGVGGKGDDTHLSDRKP